MKVGPTEILGAVDFTADGQSLFLDTSIGSDTARVVQRSLASGAEKLLAQSPEVDAGQVMVHPEKRIVEAVSFEPTRQQWKVIDPAVQADFDARRCEAMG